MWLCQPLLRRKLKRRGEAEAGYQQHVEERFGRYAPDSGEADGGYLWVHAVSLGETRTAAMLVERMRQRLPGLRLLLTHGTATGRAEGVSWLRPGDRQVWLPWDTRGAVQRFLNRFKPRLGVLIETELWPNLSAACAQHGVPLVMVNARLSEKSLRQTRRMGWLARPAYRALTAVWAQTADDARRLASMGAPVKGALGNLKFDADPNSQKLAQGQAWRAAQPKPVLMLAVSREGEEAALLDLLAATSPAGQGSPQAPGLNPVQWLIVPRHPQRFDAVATLIESCGFGVSRRSAWSERGPSPATTQSRTVWLGDSLGEMALYYGLADVALLGGSFEPLGGQNLIEAAACGCPVVMGPHTFNFAQAAELAVAAGAALRASDLGSAVTMALALAADPLERARRSGAGTEFGLAHRGALDRTCDALLALIGQQGVDRS
ncbi:MAG: 3-deoxy-D-manno-octulosonic acid transferase [Rhodoferax sp.]|nr:3-deoxy-D-manno-octulosonic acid transferase [Rhodoferax sp.]